MEAPPLGEVAPPLDGSLDDPKHIRFTAILDDQEKDAYNDVPTYPPRPSYRNFHSGLNWETQLVHFDGCPDDPYRPCSVPIYMTSTFEQPSSTEFGPYDYSRSGNPTRTALERQVAMMENAFAAFAFSSGMAALGAVVRSQCCAGDTVLLSDDIYGGMHRLCARICTLHGIKVRLVNTSDLSAVRDILESDDTITLLHFESPTNPMLHISDISGLADLVKSVNEKRVPRDEDHQNGSSTKEVAVADRHDFVSVTHRPIVLSIDSTMMTPFLQNPINHGADIVVHSATKFLSGTSDVMGGIVCVASPTLAKTIAFFQNAEGSALSPFDSWLFLRGIKTLAIRVKTAQANAIRIAAFLRAHKVPTAVHFTVHDDKVHNKQARGPGSVISFTTGSVEISRSIIDNLQLFKLTVSFGSVTSLAEMPATLSHASIPAHERTIPDDLIRLSIGIEDVDDLLSDLRAALAATVPETPITAARFNGDADSVIVPPASVSLTNVQRVRGGGVATEPPVFKISARVPSTMHTTDRPTPQLPVRPTSTHTPTNSCPPPALPTPQGSPISPNVIAAVAIAGCLGGFFGGLVAGIAVARRVGLLQH